VTVGLASHMPCVTDDSSLSNYGLNGLCQGDEHPADTLLLGMAFTLLVAVKHCIVSRD